MLKRSEVDAIANALNKRIRPPVPIEAQVWTTSDIADYLRMSEKYVRQTLVNEPGFPAPLKTIYRRQQWSAKQVIDWRMK